MSLENNQPDPQLSDIELEEQLYEGLAKSWDAASEPDEGQTDDEAPRKAAQSKKPTSEADEGDDPDEEDEDGEQSDPDEETEDEDKEQPTLVKLKGGEEVTLDELESGYLREKDYRQKTMELATLRKEFASASEAVAKAEKDAREALELTAKVMQALLPQAPSLEGLRDNPQDYMLRKAEYDAQVALLNDIVARANETGKATQAANETMHRDAIRNEFAELARKAPELKTPKAYEKWLTQAAQEAEEYWGADQKAVFGISDHVSALILRDALAYRKAQNATKSKPAQPGQARTAQPSRQARVLRPGQPGRIEQVTSTRKLDAAFARLDRGAGDDDLAALVGKAYGG